MNRKVGKIFLRKGYKLIIENGEINGFPTINFNNLSTTIKTSIY